MVITALLVCCQFDLFSRKNRKNSYCKNDTFAYYLRMSEQLGEANGFAHAFNTWFSRGDGMNTKRDGVFRYQGGPMKGMTRDQAEVYFQNNVWRNAPPEWKDEYAKRATTDLLSPSEKSDLERRKAFASPITQPQYNPASAGNVTMAQGNATATTPVSQPTFKQELGATPYYSHVPNDKPTLVLQDRVVYPGDDSNWLQGPPTSQEREVITKARFKREEYQKNNDRASGQFDVMKADYANLTPEERAQRTQANVEKAKQKAKDMGMAEEMPAMSVTAPRMKPLETKYDMAQGRVVQTGGDADQAFTNYDKAQNAARAGTATAQQRQTVVDYVGQDVLGRQPGQIAKQREDERKGYYQAGRYVGPPQGQPTAPRMPVSAPVFASGGKRSNPAPVATRQPSFGNRAGTGATRMPI